MFLRQEDERKTGYMYKYTVYMYTCSSLSFIHAYTVGQPIPRSHLADVIPTQALRTLRSPQRQKELGKLYHSGLSGEHSGRWI